MLLVLVFRAIQNNEMFNIQDNKVPIKVKFDKKG